MITLAIKLVGMLIVQGLTFTIGFESQTRDAFNKEFTGCQKSRGGLSISINFSPNSSTKHSETLTQLMSEVFWLLPLWRSLLLLPLLLLLVTMVLILGGGNTFLV